MRAVGVARDQAGFVAQAALVVAGGVGCAVLVVALGLPASLLLLAEAALALAVLARPEWGVPGVLAAVYVLPFGVNSLPGAPVHPAVVDVMLACALFAWVLRLLTRPGERLVVTGPGALLLVFLGVGFAVLLFNLPVTPPDRLRLFLRSAMAGLLFFSVLNTVRAREDLRRVARAWVLLAALAGLIGIVLYALPADTGARFLDSLTAIGYPDGGEAARYVAGTDTLRATGTAVDPNLLGGMLLIAVPLAAAQLFAAKPLVSRPVAVVGMLCVGVALLLTLSRTAWAGAGAGVVVLGALRYRRALLLPAAALGALALPQGRLFAERLLSGVFFSDQAAQMRVGEYQDAVHLIALRPILGAGFGDAPSVDTYMGVSNVYLLIGEQVGLVGMGLFLAAVVSVLWVALRWGKRRADGLETAALAGMVAALTAGLFDHYFVNIEFPQAVALFWGMAGLAVAAARTEEEAPSDESRPGTPRP